MQFARYSDLIEVFEQLSEELVGVIAEVDACGCVPLVD